MLAYYITATPLILVNVVHSSSGDIANQLAPFKFIHPLSEFDQLRSLLSQLIWQTEDNRAKCAVIWIYWRRHATVTGLPLN